MTQENQKSVRILQAKTKKPKNQPLIWMILAGVIVVILLCIFIIFIYNTPNDSDHSSEDISMENNKELISTLNDAENPNHQNEDTYQNQVNDQELSGLFQHQKAGNPANAQNTSSPFDTFLKEEQKSVTTTTAKPIKKLANIPPSLAKAHHPHKEIQIEEVRVKPLLLEKMDLEEELKLPPSESKNVSLKK